MSFEVEQKYRVANLEGVRHAIANSEAKAVETVTQVDTYYAHPDRDFAATDEALRIRRVGGKNLITYKGPKIDATTKTRREIEIEIASGEQAAVQGRQLLEALSFRRVADVSKTRSLYRLERDGGLIELALDEVDGVGAFVELEVVVDGEGGIEPARQAIAAVASELNLTDVERQSYLELLLASDQNTVGQ